MAKPEIEFIDYDTEYEWRPVEGDTLGIKEKILSLAPATGDYTRMLKFPPGIHTDRNLEEFHIPRSKQICPNITSQIVWPLEEIKEHWDTLTMRCSVVKDGKTTLYQEGELGLLLNPEELITFVKEKIEGPLDGTVIYSGTFKMLTDDFIFADTFSGELVDNKLKRKIEFSYDVRPLDYMEV